MTSCGLTMVLGKGDAGTCGLENLSVKTTPASQMGHESQSDAKNTQGSLWYTLGGVWYQEPIAPQRRSWLPLLGCCIRRKHDHSPKAKISYHESPAHITGTFSLEDRRPPDVFSGQQPDPPLSLSRTTSTKTTCKSQNDARQLGYSPTPRQRRLVEPHQPDTKDSTADRIDWFDTNGPRPSRPSTPTLPPQIYRRDDRPNPATLRSLRSTSPQADILSRASNTNGAHHNRAPMTLTLPANAYDVFSPLRYPRAPLALSGSSPASSTPAQVKAGAEEMISTTSDRDNAPHTVPRMTKGSVVRDSAKHAEKSIRAEWNFFPDKDESPSGQQVVVSASSCHAPLQNRRLLTGLERDNSSHMACFGTDNAPRTVPRLLLTHPTSNNVVPMTSRRWNSGVDLLSENSGQNHPDWPSIISSPILSLRNQHGQLSPKSNLMPSAPVNTPTSASREIVPPVKTNNSPSKRQPTVPTYHRALGNSEADLLPALKISPHLSRPDSATLGSGDYTEPYKAQYNSIPTFLQAGGRVESSQISTNGSWTGYRPSTASTVQFNFI